MNRSNNSRGDDRNARPVSGLDFWRAGPDGAAGFVQVAALGRRVSDRKASVNASPYRSCLNGLCQDRRRSSNRPVLIRATHPNGETGMSRNKASGYTLSNNDASIVLGMVARGDRDHDIAAWFGVNQGRNRRSKGGQIWNNCRGPGKSVAAQGATRHQGPRLMSSMRKVLDVLEKNGADGWGEAKDILKKARPPTTQTKPKPSECSNSCLPIVGIALKPSSAWRYPH